MKINYPTLKLWKKSYIRGIMAREETRKTSKKARAAAGSSFEGKKRWRIASSTSLERW